MATIAGKDASITVAGYDVYAHAWNMDIVAAMLEDTNWDWAGLDVNWQSFIPGLLGATGSFQCRMTDAPGATLLPGTKITDAKFYVKLSTTQGFKADIWISALHPAVTIEGLSALNVDFTVTGDVVVGNIG